MNIAVSRDVAERLAMVRMVLGARDNDTVLNALIDCFVESVSSKIMNSICREVGNRRFKDLNQLVDELRKLVPFSTIQLVVLRRVRSDEKGIYVEC